MERRSDDKGEANGPARVVVFVALVLAFVVVWAVATDARNAGLVVIWPVLAASWWASGKVLKDLI